MYRLGELTKNADIYTYLLYKTCALSDRKRVTESCIVSNVFIFLPRCCSTGI